MKLTSTISKQAGRRYPQMCAMAGTMLRPLPLRGTSATSTFSVAYTVNSNAMVGPVTPQPVIR